VVNNRVLIVMPTYNEAENIRPILARVRAAVPAATILVMDDNSPDGTGAIVDELATTDPLLLVRHRPGKRGLGAAYLDGFRWGLDNGFEKFVEIDADGSHPPETLPSLLALDADLAIGSRWMRGGSVVDWPKRRELLSRAANLYTDVALGLTVRDATAGFRVYTRALLEQIPFEDIDSKGYCFQIDMTYRAAQLGASIEEFPIVFREREFGVSKMSGSIVGEAMKNVTVWGFRRLAPKRRSKLSL
jgi:dolichol-phosphate mannosyltransferase